MSVPSKDERVSFWQHCYARSSFVQARLYVELLLAFNPPENAPLRRAITVTIVGVYCRPFKQRDPVRLPGEIVPAEHRETHDTMIELRDKVVAHRDLDGPVTDWGFISQLQINVRANELTFDTISPSITNPKAQETLPLIDFLIAEMERCAMEFVTKHLSHLPSADASYVVSLDDSPPQWLLDA